MSDLTSKKCIPCSVGDIPLNEEEIQEYLESLDNNWKAHGVKFIEKTYRFKDFREALDFTIKVGDLAEEEGHHPNINLSWGRVIIKLMTNKIEGLHENDFILAAKIDNL